MDLENIIPLPIGDIAIVKVTQATDGSALAGKLGDFARA